MVLMQNFKHVGANSYYTGGNQLVCEAHELIVIATLTPFTNEYHDPPDHTCALLAHFHLRNSGHEIS